MGEDQGITLGQFWRQDPVAQVWTSASADCLAKGKAAMPHRKETFGRTSKQWGSFSPCWAPPLSQLTRVTHVPNSSNSSLPHYDTTVDKYCVRAPRNTGEFCKYKSGGRQCSKVKSCRCEACQTPQPFNLCMRARKNKSLDKQAWCGH